MQNLNYHHLWHFFTVSRLGSLRAAAEHLFISPSTLSEQIKALEQRMNGDLFARQGRSLRLTALGRHVHSYAEKIFAQGQELIDSIQDGSMNTRLPLRVGVVNAMPKVVAYHLMAPLLAHDSVIELHVTEDEMPHLLANLVNDKIDVILSDSPTPPHHAMRVYNHRLGESQLGVFISQSLKTRKKFPQCLNGQTFLMPTENSTLSLELERWFELHQIKPIINARFENSALLKFFASRGHGAFAAPVMAQPYLEKQYLCALLGIMDRITEHYYAITSDRRIKHPGIQLIQETAHNSMIK